MWRANWMEKTLILGKTGGRRRREWWRMKWSDSITDWMDINLSKLWETVKDREPWHAAIHGITKSDMTEQRQAGVNIDILGINELKWTGIGGFNSDDHYISERSYPMPKVRGGGQEEQPPRPRSHGCSVAKGPRELFHVQGQEGQPWEDTPLTR